MDAVQQQLEAAAAALMVLLIYKGCHFRLRILQHATGGSLLRSPFLQKKPTFCLHTHPFPGTADLFGSPSCSREVPT